MPERPVAVVKAPSMTEPLGEATSAGRWRLVAACVLVSLLAAAASLPPALLHPWLSPDAIEHLGIAHNWVHGAGLVDPVQWNFYLERGAPLPSLSVRAPLVSLLAAIPLALGASVKTVGVLHALFACAMVGVMVWVGSRFVRLPAAVAAALLLGLAPGWTLLARYPWTEAVSLGALLLVLASARGVIRSPLAALACAATTVLAWLARPNLSALFLAVLAAGVWELGPRRALRSLSLWTYAVVFFSLYGAIRIVVSAATGLAPYEGYGVVSQFFHVKDLFEYQREYPGPLEFMLANREQVLARLLVRLRQVYDVLFLTPRFHFIGWGLLPAAIYGVFRRRDGFLEHRVAAFCAVGFSLMLILNYSGYDPNRYPFFAFAFACLSIAGALDEGLRRLAARWRERGPAGLAARLRFAPVAAVILLVALTTAHPVFSFSLEAWRLRPASERPVHHPGLVTDNLTRPLCRHVDRDGLVAVAQPLPWKFYMWCGNAVVLLPPDLQEAHLQQRFFDEKHPAYVVSNERRAFRWLEHFSRVQAIGKNGPWIVYEVRDAGPESRPWKAPPPLACAGKEPACRKQLGR